MGKVYVLREPRSGDEAWNIYALREAARLKRWFAGVYYSPRLGRLLAVFRPTPGTHVNVNVFEEMGESVLRDAYRMECPQGCNRCCVTRSGAFMLDVEVRALPEELRDKVMVQPSYTVKTPGGRVRVYRLDTGPMGRCVFFDMERGGCTLERALGKKGKPIVCMLTYCTLFASRGGRLYLKTGYTVRQGRVLIRYREVGREEWERAVERMGSLWRRLRRMQRRAAAGEQPGSGRG